MNTSVFGITLILALGSVGCAGVGAQYAGTSVPGANSAQYAGGQLGTLWESSEPKPVGFEQEAVSDNVGSDLWNPAAVSRSWETEATKADPKAPFATTSTGLKF
jgi:hypothetical protein